jgi:pantetheine-phosphate adenylyltransferase
VLKKYSSIGLGGTFDHLHIGHRHFLHFADSFSEHLVIGVVTDELAGKKEFPFAMQSYQKRYAELEKFLQMQNISFELFPLDNPFGPTLSDSSPEAVAVTMATKKGAELINQKRKDQALEELPVCVCNLLQDNSGQFISSTRIRAGKINREGEIFSQVISQTLQLNKQQRDFFSQLQGKIVTKVQPTEYPVFVVGDIVLDTFLEENWPFHLGVFDRKNFRKEHISKYITSEVQAKLKNQAGVIETAVVSFVEKLIEPLDLNSQSLLEVDGEEDLISVILGLIAPLNSRIYYGQVDEGMVEMIASEELKEKFAMTLNS